MSCSRVPWQCSKGVLAPLLLPTHLPKWELWTWESLYVMTWNVCPFFFLYVCSVELGYKHKRPRPGFKIYTLVSQDGRGGVQFPCVSQLSSQSLLLPVRHVFAWCCCFLLAFAWSHRCSHLAYSGDILFLCLLLAVAVWWRHGCKWLKAAAVLNV